jgi:hypothetical protein
MTYLRLSRGEDARSGRSGRRLLPARIPGTSEPAPLVQEPRLFRTANRIADAAGLFRRALVASELMALAQRQTGLSDFGDWHFEEPLEVLLQSYESEADLSPFGRLAARWDTLRFLTNLLELREVERKHPEILSHSIVKPIFITGLPRSGTTFLHELMAEDKANSVVHCWETVYPSTSRNFDRKRKAVDRQLAVFGKVAPEVRTLHTLSAASPQECTEITAHVFASLRFDTTHHVPSYREWMDERGHRVPYGFHKRFLQHLQHRKGPGQWVLKCPDHVFALDDLCAVYPDARFIFIHRDPLEVLPSVARLTEVLRRPFTRSVDRAAIGRQVAERWQLGVATLVAASERLVDADRVLHLKFDALVADPVGTVAGIYERMGLKFTPDVALGVAQKATLEANQTRPRGGVRLEQYGLVSEFERDRHRDYVARFDL